MPDHERPFSLEVGETMRRFLSVLIAVFALTLAVSAATLAHGNEKHYRADLASLNSSGVSGTAELTLSGDQLTVTITATGLEPNAPHPQHIHGAVDNKGNATCPPPAADVNGDGVVVVQRVGEELALFFPKLK